MEPTSRAMAQSEAPEPASRAAGRALEVLRILKGRVRDDVTLIGVGGITAPEDARARIDAGATLVQGYTAFVYEGPLWPRRIVRGLATDA